MTPEALLDSNVLVAALAEAHEHHEPSAALFADSTDRAFAVAAHSYAEAYSTLTRRGERALFRLTPEEALAALERIRSVTALVGLTAAQSFDAVRDYAQSGGTGARLYDRLIGEVAVAHGIPTIVTWNEAHMRGLFPELRIVSPEAFASASG